MSMVSDSDTSRYKRPARVGYARWPLGKAHLSARKIAAGHNFDRIGRPWQATIVRCARLVRREPDPDRGMSGGDDTSLHATSQAIQEDAGTYLRRTTS
jgi:hypothetical protein